MSETITGTNTKIANMMEDVFKVLLKLLDEKEQYLKDRLFLKTMKEKDTMPAFLSLNSIASKRLVKEMEEMGIPYMQFKVKGTTNDILLIRADDKKRVQDLENSIRIHVGLEIDTKEELDRALCLTESNAKECVISGLTEYEADRVIQLSQNTKNKFTVVKKEIDEGIYLVATHEKNAPQVSRYAVTAVLENESGTKDMADIIAGRHYLNQQKREFEAAVEEIMDTGRTEPAYLFSLTKPDKYIRIQEYGFEIIDRGIVTHSMSIASNPTFYPDALKIVGSTIETPVFKLKTEVEALNGMQNALTEAKNHIPGSISIKNYPYDAAFKKWVNDEIGSSNGYIFKDAGSIKNLNPDMFAFEYLRKHPQDKDTVEKKLPVYKKQLEALYDRLQNISITRETPKIRIEDIFSRNGLDIALHEEFYSKEEIERINKGAYQKDVTENASPADVSEKTDVSAKLQPKTQPQRKTEIENARRNASSQVRGEED